MSKEAAEAPQTKKTKTRRGWKLAKGVVMALIIVGLAGFGGYYFKKYNDLKNNPISAEEAKQKENKKVISSVSKLYSLPNDEQPTIFFVSDKDKLSEDYKKQEFFQKSVNGDYILIYDKAKLALLYRPSANQLVDVKPYTIQNGLAVAIIGPEVGRNAVDKLLKDTFKNEVSVVGKADSKGAYVGYTVVDVSGKYAEQAKKIAETLKGKVGTLPDGETKPSGADILIIVGSAPAADTPAPAQ